MVRWLECFGLIQIVCALSLVDGRTCRHDILVAVDFLFLKYDCGLMAQGLVPVNMHAKVHNTNHTLKKRYRKKKNKKPKGHSETRD